MRKKLLLEQNIQLFDRLPAAEGEIKRLKNELEEEKRRAAALKEENARLTENKGSTAAPLKILESKVIKQAGITPDTDYGAAGIGKTVIAVVATKYWEKFITRENAKELINLILGRTEVAKAEILNIVTTDNADEEKRRLIDEQLALAEDYFASVTAQTE